MSNPRFRVGLLAVLALVALRLALGCHFLYEGVWKIKHSDFLHEGVWRPEHAEEFSAEPFLTQAKGPAARFFYAMVPDIDARERLRIATDENGKKWIPAENIVAHWDRLRQDFVEHYRPAEASDGKAEASHERLDRAAERTFNEFRKKLREYLAEHFDEIAAYFGSLERFEKDKKREQDAPFQKQRRWDRMMELRRDADKWIKDIDAQQWAYANALYSLLDENQRKQGLPTVSWNPLRWERKEQINFAVTFGLTAIGLCLMLGLCTRPAALGGAAFMCFVVLTQPAFPGIYPPDPPIVGHALLVNKDFVEMVALLVVAATAAGRWCGLDFFVSRWLARRRAKKQQATKKP